MFFPFVILLWSIPHFQVNWNFIFFQLLIQSRTSLSKGWPVTAQNSVPNSLLSIPFTVQLQPPPPLKGPQEWGILKRSSYSRCHSFPIYFSQCVFFPPHRCTGQWGKNVRKNKTSLIKYLIPQEATQNSERLSPGPHGTQWFQSGARKVLWNHLIQEGSVVPLENEGKFLEWQYICTFFFFFFFSLFGCGRSYVHPAGSSFLTRGSNPGPLHWDCGVFIDWTTSEVPVLFSGKFLFSLDSAKALSPFKR